MQSALCLLTCMIWIGAIPHLGAATGDSPQRRPGQSGSSHVYKDQFTPHWFAGNTRFWYSNSLPGGAKEFIRVDAEKGVREMAFDHTRLATSLSAAAGAEFAANRLPLENLEFSDDASSMRFTLNGKGWRCNLSTYVCTKDEAFVPAASDSASISTRRQGRAPRSRSNSDRSPDGLWSAFVKDHNVFIRSETDTNETIQLSTDGKDGLSYGRLSWAPDSKSLLAFRIEPGDRKEVYLVQSSPPGGGRAKLQSRPYPLPGDKFATYEPNVFDVASRKQTRPEVDRFQHEWLTPDPHWSTDGSRVAWEQVDRGHQRLRVIELNAHTGEVRNLIDERSQTFIWTAHTENLGLNPVTWLELSEEIIHASENSGWRQLYLMDRREGKLKNRITKGEWVVRGIDLIDETNRVVWFNAGGVYPDQDPYFLHYGRVNFDGSGLVFLTASNGTHSVSFSPDRRFLIDTYSRADQPPISELRRASDGKFICALEAADITELKATGWEAPEVFVSKGRDGKTDVWGLIYRPKDLDKSKHYPVIEEIYAGPQSAYVPKAFSASSRYESLTKLGFVVVKIDGMGTAHRSKAFHDVCWHNLKDGGFPDRILWMKAASAKYPYIDVSRVGAFGTSAGAQNAAGAVLFYPEFYKAAVANSGCHDNRLDKASWNEQWMGYPVGPQYAENSNIENAARLQGHLFLIVGELDDNVPPESTYRFVDSLIKADKDFDLLIVPGGGHGSGGAYAARRREDFFVRHLLGVQPPNHNAQSPGRTVAR